MLDVGLPEMDGWSVMEKLKSNPRTRHIPVHFVSGQDAPLEALKMGAIGYLMKPAVILMDIMMPEMDGYQTMQEVRKDARFTNLPIIALTAKAMKGDRRKSIESGANDYLSKACRR